MKELALNFWGCLKLYQSYTIRVLIIGILIEIIFLLFLKKGYTKYKIAPFSTFLCGLFLSFSIAALITMTLYGRTLGTELVFHFQLFGSYIEAFHEENVEVLLQIIMNMVMFVPIGLFEYSCAATPQIRQTGNRLSGLAETAYTSLLAQCFV